MKEKRVRIIGISAGVLLALLLTLWLLRVVRINQETQNSQTVVNMGEEIESDGIKYRITDAVIYDYAAMVQEYEDYNWMGAVGQYHLGMLDDGREIKYLIYTVQIQTDGEGKKVSIPIQIESDSGLFSTAFDMYLNNYLNEGIEELPVNAEATLRVPFSLDKIAFTQEEWDSLADDNIPLNAVIALQPEKKMIHLDRVEHRTGDAQAQEKLQTLIAMAQELQEGKEENRQLIQDTHIYENNEGDCNGMHYSIGELEYLTWEEADALGAARENPWDDSDDLYYKTEITLTNTTDKLMQTYLTSTWICRFNSESMVRWPVELRWQSANSMDDQDATLMILEPGESIEMTAVYMCIVPLGWQEEEKEMHSQWDYYLAVNPNGGEIAGLENRQVVFIRFENGLVYREE